MHGSRLCPARDATTVRVRAGETLGQELQPPASAKTVHVRDERALVTDGPFVETKELIAGFDILDCSDLDEALGVAAKHPVARYGALDLRPFGRRRRRRRRLPPRVGPCGRQLDPDDG
jgi:hypothetical protein